MFREVIRGRINLEIEKNFLELRTPYVLESSLRKAFYRCSWLREQSL